VFDGVEWKEGDTAGPSCGLPVVPNSHNLLDCRFVDGRRIRNPGAVVYDRGFYRTIHYHLRLLPGYLVGILLPPITT